jgi:UDP-N-acetylglucosamine-lysosomal-enzyme
VVLEWSMQKYSSSFNVYHDNLGGKSFQDRLCLPVPIDVVYTWVNGSDHELLSQLKKLKLELEQQENKTMEGLWRNGSEVRDASKLLKKAITAKRKKLNQVIKTSIDCSFANCVAARILILVNVLKGHSMSLKDARSLHPAFKLISEIRNSILNGPEKDHIVMLYFPNADTTRNGLQEKIKWNGENIDSFQGYFTTNVSSPKTIRSEYEVIVTGFKKYTDLAQLQQTLHELFGRKMTDISYEPSKHIAVVYFNDKSATERVLEQYKGNFTVEEGILKIHPAFLVWSNIFSEKKEQSKRDYEDNEENEISANRFADNQELKYSLRSVEKFAPWVRNVYIVTNGQIPTWLNLDNPRIKIIPHKEIFRNQSHLPTFSSPAIESHIHRIPGLSQKFIYMNDDVMFGDNVWPDDFYTHANGQKLYLTWPVPNCNDGCPANWIRDKYCDKACNVSDCDYDGGDCIGVKQGSRYSYQSWHHQQSRFRLDFCSSGCADTWVGDRYCDTACNVLECGFDAGDCGISKFDMLYRVDVRKNNQNFDLPDGLKVLYFNISQFFRGGKITEADHSEDAIIRTSVVAQKHKLLTLTLRTNCSTTNVSFRINGFYDANQTKKVELNFNITVQTTGTFQPMTKPPPFTTQSSINPTSPKVLGKNFKAIKILYSNKAINYWTAVNSSIPQPTWMEIDSSEYNVPYLSNDTALPQEISKALQDLQAEFQEGDLTEKGFRRRKGKILREYLNNTSYYGNQLTTHEAATPSIFMNFSSDPNSLDEQHLEETKRKVNYNNYEKSFFLVYIPFLKVDSSRQGFSSLSDNM